MAGSGGAGVGVIKVIGARENNLRNISVEIPKRKLTVLTGVSGSGKSSLAFETIASESSRLLNETYPAYVQGFMASQDRPDVDSLEGLTAAVIVDQERMGNNPRSTLGTATDVDAKLRALFARRGEPRMPGPQAFSFNVPSVSGAGAVTTTKGGREVRQRKSFEVVGGMCPRCEGTGRITEIDVDALIDRTKSLEDGAMDGIPGFKAGQWSYRAYAESGLFDPTKPVEKFTKKELNDFLYREPGKISFQGFNITYEGLIPRLQRSMFSKDPESLQPAVRALAERAVTFGACPDCGGTRLAEHARSVLLGGRSIADVSAMQVTDCLEWLCGLDSTGVEPLVEALVEALESFVTIGLGYLSLNRSAGSLSGGEAQRAKMVRHLASPLSDITYVFDEPTAGLHPHDVARMNSLLLQLRDKGNTVLVVEHDPSTIAVADHVIDMGPGAGRAGGTVCFEGTPADLARSGTLTGRHLAQTPALRTAPRTPTGVLAIRSATAHNLKDVSVDVPLGVITAVCGVAGSGKSSLIHDSLPGDASVTVLDQTPIKGSRRSTPATYSGMADGIRKAFAKANGVKPALFSANSEGACPACHGAGLIFTDLVMMATVSSTCEVCGGAGFADDVLTYELGGLNIADVMALPASEAAQFFAENRVKAAAAMCEHIAAAGIGYVQIGQSLTTLSGGERQRLKLAIALAGADDILVLDEPTTGLHMADVEALLALLDRLVDAGKSVIVIEHNLHVIAHADAVIELGPGAGHDGGRIVFEGTPQQLAEGETLTGIHLREAIV